MKFKHFTNQQLCVHEAQKDKASLAGPWLEFQQLKIEYFLHKKTEQSLPISGHKYQRKIKTNNVGLEAQWSDPSRILIPKYKLLNQNQDRFLLSLYSISKWTPDKKAICIPSWSWRKIWILITILIRLGPGKGGMRLGTVREGNEYSWD